MYKGLSAFLATLLFTNSFAFADINVAIVAPKEGKYEKFGKELFQGAKIAVDDINDAGGLQGQKINLISIDDACDDTLSLSTAQMISVNNSKEDKMSLVIGPYCPNSFEEIASVYSKAGIFQIIPTTMGNDTYKQNHKGLVKLMGSKSRQGKDFFNYCKENFSDKITAIIYDGSDKEIADIAEAVKAEFVKAKIPESLKSFDYNSYKTTAKLSKAVIKSGARIAYIIGDAEEVTDIFLELKLKNKNFIIFTNKYQISDGYGDELGDLAEDSYLISLPSLKDNPAFTEELVKLRLLGIEPEGLSVYSYSAVKLWEDLVIKSKSFDYNKLSRTLQNNRFKTSWGEIVFKNGAPKVDINYCIYRFENGTYEKVY